MFSHTPEIVPMALAALVLACATLVVAVIALLIAIRAQRFASQTVQEVRELLSYPTQDHAPKQAPQYDLL